MAHVILLMDVSSTGKAPSHEQEQNTIYEIIGTLKLNVLKAVREFVLTNHLD